MSLSGDIAKNQEQIMNLPEILRGNTVIVGMGLMGGSFAKGIRELSSKAAIAGLDIDKRPVEKALNEKVINEGAVFREDEHQVRRILMKADFIILCFYPEQIMDYIITYRDVFKKGLKIIDICGLKGNFVSKAQAEMPDMVEYIGTHPMAGREKRGYEHGNGEIFLGASFIITPTENNTERTILQIGEMARALGFGRIRLAAPSEHDSLIAYTSHMPHVIASTLVNAAPKEGVTGFTGGSFKDATRVARINEELWSQLYFFNKEPLLIEIKRFIDELKEFESILKNNEMKEMQEYLKRASQLKKLWAEEVDRYDDGFTKNKSR